MLHSALSLRENGWLLSMHATGLPTARLGPERFRELAASFDLLVFNREAAAIATGNHTGVRHLPGKIAEVLAGHDHGIVVLTLGERGAALITRESAEPLLLPAPEVDVVDRTGAGDAFTGAFLAV